MWLASLGKREFLEMVLGGPSAEVTTATRKLAGKRTSHGLQGKIGVLWRDRPEGRRSFPVAAVIERSQIHDLLAALNATPQGLSPFTAFCRILDYDQADTYLNRVSSPKAEALVDAVSLLSLVEVQLLSDGQIKGRHISPAAARRTLSFVWGRGVANGLRPTELEDLTGRWHEAYKICQTFAPSEGNATSIEHLLPVLTTACGLIDAKSPTRPIEQLIAAIIESDGTAKESAWSEAAKRFALNVSLQGIESASREERGTYLQRLFRAGQDPGISELGAVQGFLATQVAPGSLEHLDIVLNQGGSEAAFWYVFFASLQESQAILNAHGGLGRRIARDVRDLETLDRPPRADIGLDELRVVARTNVDGLLSKVGHSNEITVELLPGISATFRFGRAAAAKSGSSVEQALPLFNDQVALNLRHIRSLVAKTLAEVDDAMEFGADPRTTRTRRGRY